jgi:hypothetical protein
VIDLVFVAVIVVFFVAAILLVRACGSVTAESTDFEPDAMDDEHDPESVA